MFTAWTETSNYFKAFYQPHGSHWWQMYILRPCHIKNYHTRLSSTIHWASRFSKKWKIMHNFNTKRLLKESRNCQKIRTVISKFQGTTWCSKGSMKDAGIDITVFTSHSTRSSSTSKARIESLWLTMNNKWAGWTTDFTFAKFHNKPVHENFWNICYCVRK